MKKSNFGEITDVFWAVATGVASCMGVGFVSGAEARSYFSAPFSVVVFCVVYAVLVFLLRNFVCRNNVATADELVKSLFRGKFGGVARWLLPVCGAICCVSVAGGAVECLRELFGVDFSVYFCVPLFAAAFFVCAKSDRVKKANAVAVFFGFVWVAACFVVAKGSFGEANDNCARSNSIGSASFKSGTLAQIANSAYRLAVAPTLYALFSVVTSVSVQCKTCNSSFPAAKNAVVSVLSSALTAFLIYIVRISADFSANLPLVVLSNSRVFRFIGVIAVSACAVACISSNVTGMCDLLSPVITDRALRFSAVFFVILLFVPLGFGAIMTVAYSLVACVGFCIFVAILLSSRKRQLAASSNV